jgi:hypothetical protein
MSAKICAAKRQFFAAWKAAFFFWFFAPTG